MELDNRGIDLHSLLCPWCEESVEIIDHSLILCREALIVWDKVFSWWRLGNCRVLNVGALFDSDFTSFNNKLLKDIWEGVVWVTTYLVWKNRNAKVFGKKTLRGVGLFQEIQLRSFEWIKARLRRKELKWDQWVNDPKSMGEINSV